MSFYDDLPLINSFRETAESDRYIPLPDDCMLPYLFGGDGALVAIPGEHIEEAKGIMVYCRHAIKDAFGLTLASGLVSMREVREQGHEVSVARLHVSDASDQRRNLTEYLDAEFRAKRLCYGVHPSFAAMLTCYVKSYQRNHVHFVDGTDGGYAKASQELKSRRRDLKA